MASMSNADWALLRVGFFIGIFFLALLQLILTAAKKNVYMFTLYILVLSLILIILSYVLWKKARES